MRSVTRPLLLVAAAAALCSANPLPRDDLHDRGFSYLMNRACDSYCGSDNQYCCDSGETCQTADGVANCVAAKGGWVGDYTTTWTETKTYTSTLMTRWEPAPEPTKGVNCVPKNDEQEQCGEICCAGWQTCAFKGQCSAKPGYDEPTAVVITTDGKVTTRYSAPYRVTGTTTIVNSGAPTESESESATETETDASATATETSEGAAAGETGTGGGGLSAGAIAGIVIGVIAGIALLMLLCFCCIARGLWVALFGKKDKEKSETVDVYEERYSRHGSRPPASASAHSRRPRHKGWFGFGGKGKGGSPSSAGDRREKKSDGKKWLGVAGLAATLLALLNLKKDKRPASTKPARSSRGSSRSRYSDSYYSYSDYTSPSSSSSGGRTNRTRRTRDSRARSYYSRDSRR